jgi:hypothetical protein
MAMTNAYLMLVADLLASEHLEDQKDYRLTVILALGKWGQGWLELAQDYV